MPQANKSVMTPAGLQSSNNLISSVPDGGLLSCKNVVIPYLNVLESRRGQKFEAYALPGGVWGENMYVFGGTKLIDGSNQTLYRDTGAAYSALGSAISPPAPTVLRRKFAEMNNELYLTGNDGVYRMPDAATAPTRAGIGRVTGMSSNLQDAGSGYASWLAAGKAVSYRACVYREDSRGTAIRGAVSGRTVVKNHLPIYSLVRVSNVVTAKVRSQRFEPAAEAWTTDYLTVGQTFALTAVDSADVNFAEATETIATVTAGTGTFDITYNDTGADATSAEDYTLDISCSVKMRVWLNDSHIAGMFLELYRSATVDYTVDPSDEHFKVLEHKLTSTDISNGYVDLIDEAPEAFVLGSLPLYTNEATGGGVLQDALEPPKSYDIAKWNNRMWYATTYTRARATIELLGVGSPDGVQNGDTLTIDWGGFDFPFSFSTSASSVGTPSNVFVDTTSTAASEKIENTARRLASSIRRVLGTSGLLAYYVSAEDDRPGKVIIEAQAPSDTRSILLFASRPASFAPAMGTTSGDARTYNPETRTNRLLFSRPFQPEQVPLLNFVDVGPESATILRIKVLRDKLFVFLDNGDIWTVAGEYPYRVDLLDRTAKLLAPDTVEVHSNEIYALTTQGLVAVSDAGVRILSNAWELELLELLGAAPDAVARYAFGLNYESDRQYQLWLPLAAGDTYCRQAYVYNSLYRQATRWEANRRFGLVHPTEDKLYFCDGTTGNIRVERKTRNPSGNDFVDEEYDVTISATTTTEGVMVVTLDSVTNAEVGDMLYQASGDYKGIITAVDVANVQVTVNTPVNYDISSAKILKAIDCNAVFVPDVAGAPALLKQWNEVQFHFRRFYVNTFYARFLTEKRYLAEDETVTEPGFGVGQFDEGPFGLPIHPTNKRVRVPREYQNAQQLIVGIAVREAWAVWSLEGYSPVFRPVSKETTR